jgi:hypothetical protein
MKMSTRWAPVSLVGCVWRLVFLHPVFKRMPRYRRRCRCCRKSTLYQSGVLSLLLCCPTVAGGCGGDKC